MMMFFNNNKKGVSEVVANVLIVLLVIVGVAVIWSVVKPTIDKSAKGIETGTACTGVSLEVVSCAQGDTTNDWDVVVKRNTGAGELTGLKLIFEDATEATSVVDAGAITGFDELETQTFSNLDDGTIVATKVNVAAVVGGELCPVLTIPINCN